MYSNEQKIFILKYYYVSFGALLASVSVNENVAPKKVIEKCQSKYKDHYQTEPPSRNTIDDIIAKFEANGTIENRKYKRKPTVVTPENIEKVKSVMTETQNTSTRRASAIVNISKTSVLRAIKKIGLFPYKIRILQQLKDFDYGLRLQYCYKLLNNFDIALKTFFSDESWVHLSGYINRQNTRDWRMKGEGPTKFLECPLHSEKIGVWCAMSSDRIIGPIFFENAINSEKYIDILQQFYNLLTPEEKNYFQQDNAPAHTSRATKPHLQNFFESKVWKYPPRSPDLTPLDFYLWGHLKELVYRKNPQTIPELKQSIITAIQEIPQETIKRVFNNMKKRAEACISANGGHFEHILH
jgi:transposase